MALKYFCFQILDYTQYYLDLQTANQKDTAQWEVEYNLTSYYGFSQVTPLNLHQLKESFTVADDHSLFYRSVWARNQFTRTTVFGSVSILDFVQTFLISKNLMVAAVRKKIFHQIFSNGFIKFVENIVSKDPNYKFWSPLVQKWSKLSVIKSISLSCR